ncbi:Imm42 family immunity protein [Paenibacillus daejeonensis]|uniref:Imm42 family immunity protein n=1 Tax=Paenibacillus daejeonensis TaxID=135193 RepID=UPI0003718F98|nr:Imm42 family immunity protein [Paenibacillus daejeonensis]
MIIGNPSTFAVEYELEPNYEGVCLLGKFCYWVQGEQIGEYALGTSLRDVLFQIETFVRDNGNRFGQSIIHLNTQDFFNKLNDALYGTSDNLQATEEQWARFNVCPSIDVFSNWKIFLVQESTHSRLILKNISQQRVSEVRLQFNEFENVIREVYEKINNLYENAMTSET